MSKVIQGQNWNLTPAADGRRYSKYPAGDVPIELPARINNFIATNVTSSAVTFTWSADPLATSYTLGRGLGDGFGSAIVDSWVDVATVNAPTTTIIDNGPVGGFVEGQQYYWRVAGINAAGQGLGATRLFITPVSAVEPPAPPIDVVPASLIVEQNFSTIPLGDYFGQRITMGSGKGTFLFEVYSQTGGAIVASPVYEGNRSARMTCTANATGPELYLSEGGVADLGGKSRYRAEINFNQAIENSGYRKTNWWGMTLWFGFALKLADDWHVGCKLGGVVHQVINRAWEPPYTSCNPVEGIYAISEGDGFTAARRYFDVYPFQLDPPQTGTVGRKSSSTAIPITQTQAKNGWIRIVHRIKFHPYGQGAWSMWTNNALAFEQTNITTYPDDPEFLGFKVGLYQSSRAGIENYHVACPHDSHVFVSSVRCADEALGGNYATVDPANYV